MQYYVTKSHPDCPKWAVVRENFELVAAHSTKKSATQQMVAISKKEKVEIGGEHLRDKRMVEARQIKEVSQDLYVQLEGDEKALVDAMIGVVSQYGRFQGPSSSVYAGYMSPAQNKEKENGIKCGNCVFHFEESGNFECSAVNADIEEEGLCRLAMIPPQYFQETIRVREAEKKYKIPEGVQNAATRAVKWISGGKAGDGFTDTGRSRAIQLANGGSVTREVAVRMKSYFARHTTDRKAEGFNAGEKNYPSPGRVAWDAWGGDAGKTWTNKLNLDK